MIIKFWCTCEESRIAELNMVFIIVQIKCGLKVVKPWYGCVIVDSCMLSDLYYEFSGGQLDGSLPLLDEYLGATVESFVGRTKTDLIRVNCQCVVGEVVSSLGQYVEFCLTKLDTVGNCQRGNRDHSIVIIPGWVNGKCFRFLMRGSREKSSSKEMESFSLHWFPLHFLQCKMFIKNKKNTNNNNKMPPPSSIFYMRVDDKQLIYFTWPNKEIRK